MFLYLFAAPNQLNQLHVHCDSISCRSGFFYVVTFPVGFCKCNFCTLNRYSVQHAEAGAVSGTTAHHPSPITQSKNGRSGTYRKSNLVSFWNMFHESLCHLMLMRMNDLEQKDRLNAYSEQNAKHRTITAIHSALLCHVTSENRLFRWAPAMTKLISFAKFITFDVKCFVVRRVVLCQTTIWCLSDSNHTDTHTLTHVDHNRFASDYQTQFSIIKSVCVLFSLPLGFHVSMKFLNVPNELNALVVYLRALCSFPSIRATCQLFKCCQRNEFCSR